MNDFYVYAWKRPDGTPFYIGKGRAGRDRSLHMRNKVFLRIMAKIRASGEEPKVERVHTGLTEAEALHVEAKLISHYGRIKYGGILCNLTDGGEGVSGHVHDEDTLRRMRDARKRRWPQVGLYKGVSAGNGVSYGASIEVDGKTINVGRFPTAEEAARAYDAAAVKVWGDDCYLNFPDDLGDPVKRIAPKRTKERAMRLRAPAGQYKGIIFDKRRGKWQPKIVVNGRAKFPGTFATPEEAALAYDKAAIEAWGLGNCYLNFPEISSKSAKPEEQVAS